MQNPRCASIFAIAWVASCRSPATVAPEPASAAVATHQAEATSPVSGERALARVRALMELPRALGDARRSASIAALVEQLREAGANEVVRLDHVARDPLDGSAHSLTEIIGHVRPAAPRRFVLATHFDTRPWADEDPDPARRSEPVPGANDGTSGLAVVLELTPVLARALPEDVGFTVVLFDGEELGHPETGGYCMGSRHLAERVRAGEMPLVAAAELGVVLDMVGDADLVILREPASVQSHAALVDHVWSTAARLGEPAFDPRLRRTAIIDDHRFLAEAGVPSILLIDRDYVAWHRTDDTIDRLSARSLETVGMVVLVALVEWFSAPRPSGP